MKVKPITIIGVILAGVYIGSVVLANWLTTHYGQVTVFPGLVATAGTFAIGGVIMTRDLATGGCHARARTLARCHPRAVVAPAKTGDLMRTEQQETGFLRRAYLFLTLRPERCPACGHPYHSDPLTPPDRQKCDWSKPNEAGH